MFMKCTILKDNTFEKQKIPFYGNKFLMGNGYFGVRGTLEEYKKENMPCVNLAGIYDKVGDKWRESVNAPNPFYTYIKVDGEAFALPEKEPFSHQQSVNIETAIHQRKTVWESAKGKITVVCERFASMSNQHLICMKYSVSADYDCKIEIIKKSDIFEAIFLISDFFLLNYLSAQWNANIKIKLSARNFLSTVH